MKKILKFFAQKYARRRGVSKEFHGTRYGGWTICPLDLNSETVIYSFGIGEDISFDLSVIQKFDAQVFAFDPTPKSIEWLKTQTLPPNFHWFDFGLADYDGIAKFFPPKNPEHISHSIVDRKIHSVVPIEIRVCRLETIMRTLQHSSIDILKMDIEGAEYAVIDDMLSSHIIPKQLLVEFHHNFDHISISKTILAVIKLSLRGYRLFDVSTRGFEYSFIRGAK
jgi:FkbM family methyltransferase